MTYKQFSLEVDKLINKTSGNVIGFILSVTVGVMAGLFLLIG